MSDCLQPHGLYTGVDSLSLLQGIFPTQGSNPGLQHCRWILSQLSYQGQLPMSTGFSPVVTKSDHKAAAFFHAQIFSSFGNIIFIFYWISDVFVSGEQEHD